MNSNSTHLICFVVVSFPFVVVVFFSVPTSVALDPSLLSSIDRRACRCTTVVVVVDVVVVVVVVVVSVFCFFVVFAFSCVFSFFFVRFSKTNRINCPAVRLRLYASRTAVREPFEGQE